MKAKKNKKQALGRGLSALLDDTSNDVKLINDANTDGVIGNIIDLDLKKIEINPFQPRTNFNQEAVLELAESIKALGIIQPITVRKLDNNKYQLVSGERRLRAAKSLKFKNIPAYVRIANDQEILEMALVENIQRKDLDPIEIGLCYQRLVEEIKLTQKQLSQRVGKKRSTVANYIRLLKLDPIIQSGIRDGFLSMGHGRALINIEEQEKQLEIYEKIIAQGLSVRNTENLVQRFNSGLGNKKKKLKTYEIYTDTENELKRHLNSKVTVKGNENGKGLDWREFKEKASLLIEREKTGHAARDQIIELMATATSEQWNDWYRRILIKDLRCGVTHKTINKHSTMKVPVFECMLATDSAKHEKKMVGEMLIEPKLDGVRVIVICDVDKDEVKLFSRNGKELSNFPEINKQFDEMLDQMSESMVFDGEVMSDDFQTLMKQVHRKTGAQTEDAY